tara:strand:- start:558 stop:1007 length:450 start_codon:yes stop_codon:yes gene_type:complete
MKTRPRPPLTLREIWEKPDDYGSDKIFTTLAVSLENTVNELDYLESDLTEETERRMEAIDELQSRVTCSHPSIQDLEDAMLERFYSLKDETLERLTAIEAQQDRAVYIEDLPSDADKRERAEARAANLKRLDRLERSVQLLKFPDMLKG